MTPRVALALTELGVDTRGTDAEIAARIARGEHDPAPDSYVRQAIRVMAQALAAGDDERAARAALWVLDPDAAMAEALAAVRR